MFFFFVHIKQQLLHLMLNFQSCERVITRDLKNSFQARNLTRAFFQCFRGVPCPLQYDLFLRNHRSVGSEILRILPYSNGERMRLLELQLQITSAGFMSLRTAARDVFMSGLFFGFLFF